MRIAMVIEAWKPICGGGQIVAYEVCKRLSKNYDCKIDLFVMNLEGYKGPEVEKRNENFRIIHVGKKKKWKFKDRLIWLIEVFFTLLKENKKSDYEIIYAHSNLPGIIAKLTSFILKVPSVYHVHGSGVRVINEMYNETLAGKIIYFLEDILQTKIKYNLEITVDRDFLNFENVNEPVYIPNGVDHSNFKAKSKKNKKTFNILFVGRLHPQKGLKILIDASRDLKNLFEKKNVRIIIVGDGPQRSELCSMVCEYGLEEIFEFRGEKRGSDLIEEYVNADLFILPSLYEGFPLTVLEAWAAKLPVLVSDVGDLPYVIEDGENGFLFKGGSSADLKKKLSRILEMDTSSLSQIAEKSYRKLVDEYTWDKIVPRIYEELKRVR